MKYGLYLGCNMPANRPDVEKAIRVSMDKLDAELLEMEGFACCPAFGTFPSCDEMGHMAVCGWNFAIAEEKDVDLLVECGSCYSSLKTARKHILEHEEQKPELDRLLAVGGKKYEGRANVRHITDVLYHDICLDRIRGSLKKTLEGLHVVVQYPCHTLFPHEIVGFDSPPGRPHILGDLVEALGATVDHYSDEYVCCGGAGGFHRWDAIHAKEFSKRKYDAIQKETNADLIVVSCITCLLYLDSMQAEISKDTGQDPIPVFDYNQLLALCQGFDPQHVACISQVPRDGILERLTPKA